MFIPASRVAELQNLDITLILFEYGDILEAIFEPKHLPKLEALGKFNYDPTKPTGSEHDDSITRDRWVDHAAKVVKFVDAAWSEEWSAKVKGAYLEMAKSIGVLEYLKRAICGKEHERNEDRLEESIVTP